MRGGQFGAEVTEETTFEGVKADLWAPIRIYIMFVLIDTQTVTTFPCLDFDFFRRTFSF